MAQQQSDVDLIRTLLREAQHSYVIAVSIVGNDPNINLLLAKWPDVTDSLINYFDTRSEGDMNQVQTDLSVVIYQPMGVIYASILQQLDEVSRGPYLNEMDKHKWQTDPVKIKNKLINLINEMIDIGKINCQKITPYTREMRNVRSD